MAKYLTTVVETYRVDSEEEAKVLIEDSRRNQEYELKKYTSEYKERKQKGEVIDSYYKVVLTKFFNDEKEPVDLVNISYEVL